MKTTRRKRGATKAIAETDSDTVTKTEQDVAEAVDPLRGSQLALPRSCTVKDAAALKQSLCGLLGESATITLDVRALERIDTAAMQLLCAFARERAGKGYPTAWMGNVAVVRQAAAMLDVESMLSLPPIDAAAPGESAMGPLT